MQNLKRLRERNGYSQTKVAKLLGMSQTGYSKYETGENDIPTERLVILAELYKVSTDYLLGRSNFKTDAEKQSNFESVAQVFLDKHNGDIAAAIKELMDELDKRKK